MRFSIKRIINEMQEFQREMHNEFKDSKTFWKHFYKKLDNEIYKEFQKLVETKEENEKQEQNEDTENPQKEVLDFIKSIAQEIWVDEIEVIEINKK